MQFLLRPKYPLFMLIDLALALASIDNDLNSFFLLLFLVIVIFINYLNNILINKQINE